MAHTVELTTVIIAFFVSLAVHQLAAAGVLCWIGNYPLAGIYLAYGISSFLYIYLI